MPNDNIRNFLNAYVTNPDPRYAEMLKGKWGCGKSYFIDGWLKTYHQPEDNNIAERNIRPLTVERKNSLFFGNHAKAEMSALYHTFIAARPWSLARQEPVR